MAEKAPKAEPTKPTQKPSLLDTFADAGPEELAAMRNRLAELDNEASALRTLEKALDEKLNGPRQKPTKPEKTSRPQPTQRQASPEAMEENRKKVAKFLMLNGPKSTVKISEATGISRFGPGALSQVISHPWFDTASDGIVQLTPKGHTENKT